MRIYKTYIKFWPLAILLLLSACYNESFTPDEGNDEIIVEASIEGLDNSRAVKLTNANLTAFGMFGFYGSTKRVNNVNYTINASTGVWKSAKPVMWANGAMNFYGISPSFDISTSNLNQTMVYDNPSFSYAVPTNTDNQKDILYSSVLNLKKADKNGKIVFSYKPGMHYFSFTSKQNIGSDYKVFIKKIVLHNLISNGTFLFDTKTSNKGTWTVASGSEAIYVNDTLEFETPVEITEAQKALTGQEYFIIMPQKVSKWMTTSDNPIPISTADNASPKQWYVEMIGQIYKVEEGGIHKYLLGNVDNTDSNIPEFESVYFPQNAKSCNIGIGSTWNIVFNGGYNKDGELYLEHIPDRTGGEGIEVEVAEWFQSDFDIEEWIPYLETPEELELK
jgi:hypothetical protein